MVQSKWCHHCVDTCQQLDAHDISVYYLAAMLPHCIQLCVERAAFSYVLFAPVLCNQLCADCARSYVLGTICIWVVRQMLDTRVFCFFAWVERGR